MSGHPHADTGPDKAATLSGETNLLVDEIVIADPRRQTKLTTLVPLAVHTGWGDLHFEECQVQSTKIRCSIRPLEISYSVDF